ncbi:DUF222 domain-containing protein, partial [Arthrobacter crystallopoietes]|uniref:DUF222 domain-containing protein n=1 Tax=Crystallibacter crystallopoietes TaxID=37928 RepID=UPI003D1C37FD
MEDPTFGTVHIAGLEAVVEAPAAAAAADAAAASNATPTDLNGPAAAGAPDDAAAGPEDTEAPASCEAQPSAVPATEPAKSGEAEPVFADPLTASEPVPAADEAEDGEEVPDWALSPRRRVERERAREAARPKPPALVEHGPVEWFQAWRDIAPLDLAVILARQDPAGLADGVLLEYLAAVEKATAWLQSLRVVGLGEFAGRRTEPGSPLMGPEGYEQGTVKELCAHLHQSRGTLAPQLAVAVQLCGHFPGTVAAMGEGRVDLGRASAIVRGSRDLPAAVLGEYEAQVLPGAEHVVRETVQDRARTARHRLHPQTLDERHTRAMEHRGLWFRPQEDGMAELSVHTGADTAMAVYNLVQEHAKHLKTLDGETRTLAQLRADVFTDLCLRPRSAAAPAAPAPQAGGQASAHGAADDSAAFGPSNGPRQGTAFGVTAGTAAAGQGGFFGSPAAAAAGAVVRGASEADRGASDVWGGGNVKAFVAVTIPLATAAGGDEPGELAGYGPIP